MKLDGGYRSLHPWYTFSQRPWLNFTKNYEVLIKSIDINPPEINTRMRKNLRYYQVLL